MGGLNISILGYAHENCVPSRTNGAWTEATLFRPLGAQAVNSLRITNITRERPEDCASEIQTQGWELVATTELNGTNIDGFVGALRSGDRIGVWACAQVIYEPISYRRDHIADCITAYTAGFSDLHLCQRS